MMFTVNKLNVSVVFEFHFVGFLCKTVARLFLSVHFLFQVLKFDSDDLRKNLTFCECDAVTVTPNSDFQHYQDAQSLVTRLWPLKKEVSLQQRIRGNKSIIDNRLTSCFTSWHSRWAVSCKRLLINLLHQQALQSEAVCGVSPPLFSFSWATAASPAAQWTTVEVTQKAAAERNEHRKTLWCDFFIPLVY